MTQKEAKAFAIVFNGHYHIDKLVPSRREAWGLLMDEIDEPYSRKLTVPVLQRLGYRCVPVTVFFDAPEATG